MNALATGAGVQDPTGASSRPQTGREEMARGSSCRQVGHTWAPSRHKEAVACCLACSGSARPGRCLTKRIASGPCPDSPDFRAILCAASCGPRRTSAGEAQLPATSPTGANETDFGSRRSPVQPSFPVSSESTGGPDGCFSQALGIAAKTRKLVPKSVQ